MKNEHLRSKIEKKFGLIILFFIGVTLSFGIVVSQEYNALPYASASPTASPSPSPSSSPYY